MPRRTEMKKATKRRSSIAESSITSLPVKPVSEVVRSRSYVFYGRSGTGKTTVLSTFPKPILLLDVNDQGTDSIMDIGDIDVLEIKEWNDFEMAYWYLRKHPGKYATLGIDTVTQLQQIAVEQVLIDNKKSVDDAGRWGTLTRGEWGEAASIMKQWITNTRNLALGGIEVVFVAQDRIFEVDEDIGPDQQLDPEVGPRLMPSVVSHLNAAVSVIGNTFIRRRVKVKEIGDRRRKKRKEIASTQYCLRIGPNPIYVTKIRKPKSIRLPSVLVDPSYEDLIDIIKGD